MLPRLASGGLLAIFVGFAPAQEQEKTEIRLEVRNPPPELPSGRTVIALTRLLGYGTVTARSCEGGAESGRHVQAREERTGIQIDSPILPVKGPFELPGSATCGFGKLVPPVHRGTEQDDTMILDAENDHVGALGGNDRIDGGKGEDVLNGGAGNDILYGGEGNDWLIGGEGNDNLFGGSGSDRLDGGLGEDVLEGGPGDDFLEGGPGKDTMFGDDGDDWHSGGAGDDVLEGGPGNDTLLGGDGNDELDGGAGDDRILGGEGDDWLKGEAGNDILEGGPGNDRLEGQDGRDHMEGGPGDDFLDGGDDADILLGGDGKDLLRGGDGDDYLEGGPGNDMLYGGDGNDHLEGGVGDDVLEGNDGDDFLSGGIGNDRILGGEGNDTLFGGPGDDMLFGDIGDDILEGGPGDDQLFGGDGNDMLRGGPGNDRLQGGRGAGIVLGGEGNDTILVSAGDVPQDAEEIIDGGPGQDTLILDGFAASLISGSPGTSSPFTIRDPLTGGSYRVSNVERIRYVHEFTYLSTGAQAGSRLLLANPSSKLIATGHVDFVASSGKPLEIPVDGGAPKSRLEFKLEPLAVVEFHTAASGPAVTGRARLEADQPLTGAVSFSAANLGSATLGPKPLTDAFALPVIRERGSGISTSVFVYNGDTGGFYELSLRRPAGAPLLETDLTTPAGSLLRRNVEELFPEIEDFRGTLWMSGASLGAFGVLKNGNRATILPAVPVGAFALGNQALQAAAAAAQAGAPAPPGRELHFPLVTAATGASSTLFLINASPVRRAKGRLEFFGPDGKPMAGAMEGESSAGVDFDLGLGGSVTYRTVPGTSAASARLRMAVGAVEAVQLYSIEGGPSVGLSPSGSYKAFLAPVRRQADGSIQTRITVHSIDRAAELRFTLRDSRGRPVAGGTATAGLTANGSVSRTIDELFPQVPSADLVGTLAVTADGEASVSAVVLQHQGVILTAAPVMELR
ncbi:MAG TPA: calcium-binding protein [Bryobacteraceae bacterium]|nr:calcium-binding protein [Bryobacteraceae bacterium]